MKISYKYGIRTMSGKLDDLVHTAWNKGRVAIGRLFVYPTLVEQHFLFGDIKQNISEIWADCSNDFKEDFKEYTAQRIPYYSAEQIPAYANYAHFIRFLYAFQKENPSVDLTEATKASLALDGCPANVADIVAEGFLPVIPDPVGLSNDW